MSNERIDVLARLDAVSAEHARLNSALVDAGEDEAALLGPKYEAAKYEMRRLRAEIARAGGVACEVAP